MENSSLDREEILRLLKIKYVKWTMFDLIFSFVFITVAIFLSMDEKTMNITNLRNLIITIFFQYIVIGGQIKFYRKEIKKLEPDVE